MKNIIQIAAFLVIGNLFAQQQPNYVLYRYTMNVINPAYAASDGITTFTSNIRSQWVNIDNAPETKSFFAATPINDKIGLGVSIVTDEVFIEKTTSFNLDFSYHLTINRDLDLFLGLKAGGRTYNIDTDGLANLNLPLDPALGNVDTGFRPNVGLGVYFYY
jgi:type IX secretion system PorP/SprF family membrane protein